MLVIVRIVSLLLRSLGVGVVGLGMATVVFGMEEAFPNQTFEIIYIPNPIKF
jgi:hypothetical protein